MTNKIVMGLSGGMDSATLLGILLEQGHQVHCCIFYYGSKHNQYEITAAEDVIGDYQNKEFPVIEHHIDISTVMKDFSSNLLLTGGEIPEGHYQAENMGKTVVPARNLIFASIMAGLAESIQAKNVALGIHQGDHHIYPDCRVEFAKALDTTVFLSSDKKVEITAPLLAENKTSILRKGYSLDPPVPYHLTRTCYKNQPISCGKCGSCIERLEAFNKLSRPDPIEYQKE
mgnify:CR=1 FL=1